SRLGSGGHYNLVYGLDGIFRVVGNDYLTLNWAQSFDDEDGLTPLESDGPLDGSLVRLQWQRRGEDGFVYSFDLMRSGRTFSPEMGFLPRSDYTNGAAVAGYGWRPAADSPFLRYAVQLDGAIFRRNLDQEVETLEAALQGIVELKTGHQLTLTFPTRY